MDEEHLNLLSIFHYVSGGLGCLLSCFPSLYVLIGIGVMLTPERSSRDPSPEIVGAIFAAMGSLFVLIGWIFAGLIVAGGWCLAKRKHYTFCMVVAGIECLFLPFGTVLGVFTLVILSRPTVRALFEQHGIPPQESLPDSST